MAEPGRCGWAGWLVAATLAVGPTIAARADLPGLADTVGTWTTARPAGSAVAELAPARGPIREGRHEEALAIIRKAAAAHPDWSPAPLILARMLMAEGQAGPARTALERAAAEAPEHPEVYLALGAVAVSDARFSDARLNYDRALALIDSRARDDRRTRVYRGEAAAGMAAVAEAREDWTAARESLIAWLELDPSNGPARSRLGGALFRLGRPDEALAALRQADRDATGREPAEVAMARLAAEAGDPRGAEDWFGRAVAMEPTGLRARLARAAWLIDQGRAVEARADVERAMEIDPRSPEARRLRATVAWHLRDLATAQAILDALHREAPADLAAANLLALCLVEQEDPAKRTRGLQLAEVDAQQAPGSPEVLATLGWARYRAGQVEPAEALLRAAARGVRISPDVAYFLARVLADRGRAVDARKILESAVGLPGAFAHREEARALLASLSR